LTASEALLLASAPTSGIATAPGFFGRARTVVGAVVNFVVPGTAAAFDGSADTAAAAAAAAAEGQPRLIAMPPLPPQETASVFGCESGAAKGVKKRSWLDGNGPGGTKTGGTKKGGAKSGSNDVPGAAYELLRTWQAADMYLRVKEEGLENVLKEFKAADKTRIRIVVRWFDNFATEAEKKKLKQLDTTQANKQVEGDEPPSPLSAGATSQLVLGLQRLVYERLKAAHAGTLAGVPCALRTYEPSAFKASKIEDSRRGIDIEETKEAFALFRVKYENTQTAAAAAAVDAVAAAAPSLSPKKRKGKEHAAPPPGKK